MHHLFVLVVWLWELPNILIFLSPASFIKFSNMFCQKQSICNNQWNLTTWTAIWCWYLCIEFSLIELISLEYWKRCWSLDHDTSYYFIVCFIGCSNWHTMDVVCLLSCFKTWIFSIMVIIFCTSYFHFMILRQTFLCRSSR